MSAIQEYYNWAQQYHTDTDEDEHSGIQIRWTTMDENTVVVVAWDIDWDALSDLSERASDAGLDFERVHDDPREFYVSELEDPPQD